MVKVTQENLDLEPTCFYLQSSCLQISIHTDFGVRGLLANKCPSQALA